MMKKIFNISAALAALTLSLGACAPTEVDDLFNESAAERLDKALTDYKSYFTDKGGKWELLYFANTDEQGFYFVVTFHDDGSVDIAGNNKFTTGGSDADGQKDFDVSIGYVKDTSLWEVQGDDGPSISFNSLNDAFHFFSDPGIIPPGATRANGAGHEGDFEFNVLSREENSCILRGKKHGLLMTMNRLPADTDDEQWIAQAVANQTNHFSPNVTTLYMTTPSGKRFVLSDYRVSLPGNQQMTPDMKRFLWLFVPEGGDAVNEREHETMVVTPKGIHFYQPLEFLTEYDASANAVQDFYFQPDGSLLGDDGATTINAGDIVDYYLLSSRVWVVDRESMSESLTEAYNNTLSAMLNLTVSGRQVTKANITSLKLIYKTVSKTEGYYALEIKFSATLKGRASSNYTTCLKLDVARVDEKTIKMSCNLAADDAFDTAPGNDFFKPLPEFATFVNLLTSGNLTLTPSSALNPVAMNIANGAGVSLDVALGK